MVNESPLKMYIAVLDEVPDQMVPVLVAHAVLGAHLFFHRPNGEILTPSYNEWLLHSFRKVVVKVNRKEFHKILLEDNIYTAHESTVLNAEKSCAVVCPRIEYPNVLKFAKKWKPA